MDVEHEYWVEPEIGAIWAVELSDEEVVACHGPLTPAEVNGDALDFLQYSPVGVTWLRENRRRFIEYPTEVPYIPPT